jgi:ribosome-associated protein
MRLVADAVWMHPGTMLRMADTSLRTENGLWVPAADMEWSYSTPGGPGGQHANRASTRATLSIRINAVRGPADLCAVLARNLGASVRVSVASHRSQYRNREACIARMVEKLESASRVRPSRTSSAPSLASRRARLEGKRRLGQKKSLRRRPLGEE